MSPAGPFDGLVCDLDGVVYRGNRAVPGAAEALARLQEDGVKILYCTNNSRPTVEDYVAKLARAGVAARPEQVLTSAVVTGERLAGWAPGGRAIVVGGPGLRAAVRAAGLSVDKRADSADVVVVGWDPEFTYDAMRRACLAVAGGARFVASNDDAAFPAEGGQLWPGAGAILASIERATGAAAEVMGKPHRAMMEAAAARLGGAERIAVVGDRDETDLAGGRAMGWTTVLVLSGVTSKQQAASLSPPPDVVLEDLSGLAGAQ